MRCEIGITESQIASGIAKNLFGIASRCLVHLNSHSCFTTMYRLDTRLPARVHREPLENRGRVFFCRRPRFNWMSLLRCRALLSVSGSFIGSLFNSGEESSALSSYSPLALPVRSPADPILYLLYRGDQSRCIPRACAARNERSPVLSVFPSVCPEDRSTGRLPYPLLAPFPISPLALLRPFSAAPARYSSLAWLPRYSISPLLNETFIQIQIHASLPCIFLTKFISCSHD